MLTTSIPSKKSLQSTNFIPAVFSFTIIILQCNYSSSYENKSESNGSISINKSCENLIKDINEVSSTTLINERSIPTAASSTGTSSKTISTIKAYVSDNINGNGVWKENILLSDYLRDCGRKDKCPEPIPPNGTTPAPSYTVRDLNIDFQLDPFACRCDEELCSQFGDCCWTVATKLVKNNPFRCHKVQFMKTWALMIGTCSDKTSQVAQLCVLGIGAYNNYTYNLDLPVYSNSTKQIYRNIYCARCNGIEDTQLSQVGLKIRCTENMAVDSTSIKTFLTQAYYVPGQLYWQKNDVYCGIYIPEWESSRLSKFIPDVRFCGFFTIDYCPSSYTDERTASLCYSYMQYINYRHGNYFYKNPHCALCNGVVDLKKNTKCSNYVPPPNVPTATVTDSLTHNLEPDNITVPSGMSLNLDLTYALGQSLLGKQFKCNQVNDFNQVYCYRMSTLMTNSGGSGATVAVVYFILPFPICTKLCSAVFILLVLFSY